MLGLGLTGWAALCALLVHQDLTGGWRACTRQLDRLGVAGLLFIHASFGMMGVLILLSYSKSLSVDGTKMIAKKYFGRASRSFDRNDIRSASIVQKGIESAVELVLADGTRLQFSQFGTNYSRLRAYLNLDGPQA
jgi:hypothetical protein